MKTADYKPKPHSPVYEPLRYRVVRPCLNSNFATNGFNPITGRTDPPLLQPSAVDTKGAPPKPLVPPALQVPLRPEGFGLVVYLLALVAGLFAAQQILRSRKT